MVSPGAIPAEFDRPRSGVAERSDLTMCGICGIFNSSGEPADPGLLDRMIGTVRHRGPDESGIWTDGSIGLAHTRLSIIDLSGGRQPMSNEDGTLQVTFNGEIFNFVELRADLEKKGHRFATRSDTEVILHLYEDEGEECVRRFNGQFSFAVWDGKRRRIFAARDRLGVRPFFYTSANGSFLFASEVKALLACPSVRPEIDLRALDQVFTFWHTLAPRTIFEGILELPPGCSMVVEGGEVRVRPYWGIDYGRGGCPSSEEECVERLRELLIDAARIRLRSDVPVGAYLSGGLDSTVIAAIIRRFSDTPLKTFSVSFDDPEFDESAFQADAVRHIGTDHHDVRCGYADIARVFPDVVWHAEKPILRTAPAPLFILSSLVRRHGYKVVLTGEGSDEMLGGYDIFKEAKVRRFWARRPDSRLRPLLLRKLYPYLRNIASQPEAYLKAFFRVNLEDLASPFFSHIPRWELTSKLKIFFSDEVRAALDGYDATEDLRGELTERFGAWDGFSQAQYLETRYLLPGYILSSQGDRMSMAHSVEGRFPFLDHRVAEFAAALPPRLKMKALDEKHILKRAAGDLIPASVRKRPKQPYRAPDAKSFFGDGKAREEYVEEILSPRRIAEDGIFDPGAVGKLVEKVKGGRAIGIKDNMALVGILSTGLVIERFIRKRREMVGPCATSPRKSVSS
jgi:asparagine synthase (glutamine-hydrolysing)